MTWQHDVHGHDMYVKVREREEHEGHDDGIRRQW